MKAGESINEAPRPYQRLFRVVSEAVSGRTGLEGRSLRDECQCAVARGEDEPTEETLRRVLIWAVYDGNDSLVAEVVRLGATVSAGINDDDSSSGDNLLYWAAGDGNEDIVRWLLAAGAGKCRLKGRSEALRVACNMGRVGVVKVLLAAVTDPSPSPAAKGSDSCEPSAFDAAAHDGNADAIGDFFQQGPIENPPESGSSAGEIDSINDALLYAAQSSSSGAVDIIDFLINEAGADVNARNNCGGTPLHEAVLLKSTEATFALLRHGAEVEAADDNGETPLHNAARSGKRSLFEALADAGANIHRRNGAGYSVLDMAALTGTVEIVEAFVQRKVDVRTVGPTGFSPLHFATLTSREVAIDALVAAGADVNAKSVHEGDTPLNIAAKYGTPETIATLYRRGADDGAMDETGNSPLKVASINGKLSTIAALAAAGTDISRRISEDELTALDCAVILGKVDILEALVECGADVRASGPRGDTPLHIAAASNSVGAIDFLVRAGADVGAKEERQGSTPLHQASERGFCEAIVALLRNGAEVDAADKDGETPLVMAIRHEKLSSVDALVPAGADPNRRNKADDMAPLDVAACCGNLDILKALLRDGSNANALDSVGGTALHYASEFEEEGLVHALVDAGADINAKDADGRAPIHDASNEGSTAVIVALMERGADKEARTNSGMTPLQFAAKCGHVSAIDALVAAGADINIRTTETNSSALDFAAGNGEVDALKALVRHGADVRSINSSGYTCLYFAANGDEAGAIDFLVGAGADVNVRTEQGFMPLHSASMIGSAEAVCALLKLGADKNCLSSTGATPLHEAVEHGQLSVANALLEAGANVGLRTQDHMSALDLAAAEGHVDILNLLLRHGADVNASDFEGHSALYKAASSNSVAAIRALVAAGAGVHGCAQDWTPLDAASECDAADAIVALAELGADVTRTDRYGLTPLQLAVDEGHVDAVNALLASGADPNQTSGEDWVILTAITRERQDILTALLLHGADTNRENSEGQTGLHAAVELEDAGVVNILLAAGADVNSGVDADDARSIHIACGSSSTDIMLTLLANGANIGVRDGNGKSPLHNAAESCVRWDSDVGRVDVLLRAGADETARDSDGLTPAELVRKIFVDDTYQGALARVTRAFERAPADRAWRRRGMLLLCRAFGEREANQPHPLAETWARRAEVGECRSVDVVAGEADAGTRGCEEEGCEHFGVLMSKLFALEEDGLFRMVVSFL